MSKILDIFFGILILIFFFNIYSFYSSNNNLESKEFNRSNIDQIINKKISNLPILKNDTDNVIEFNDGFLYLRNIFNDTDIAYSVVEQNEVVELSKNIDFKCAFNHKIDFMFLLNKINPQGFSSDKSSFSCFVKVVPLILIIIAFFFI